MESSVDNDCAIDHGLNSILQNLFLAIQILQEYGPFNACSVCFSELLI